MSTIDQLRRPLRNLRLSVTDRCNLRCAYCMPEEDYAWLPRAELLTYEEMSALADIFAELGASRVRLTGGEPLLRRDLPELVRQLAANPRVTDIALTTNGVLLEPAAAELAAAGLRRITISLDSLRADRFEALARRPELPRVLAGIAAARAAGLPMKLNAVVLRGVNDDEICDLLEFGARVQAEVRFIEYMDVGGATRWAMERVVSRADVLETVRRRYGAVEPLGENEHAPAERFRLPDGRTFGIIASTTAPFCRDCGRSRLTADGVWLLCLYARHGVSLRDLLRGGAGRDVLADTIRRTWAARTDRGAEARLAEAQRGPFVPLSELVRDPHLEMHKRGG